MFWGETFLEGIKVRGVTLSSPTLLNLEKQQAKKGERERADVLIWSEVSGE